MRRTWKTNKKGRLPKGGGGRSRFYPGRSRFYPFGLIVIVLLIFMVGCTGLIFKLKVENKLAIAEEAGYQIMFRILKEMPEGEAKDKVRANAELEFRALYLDLDNAELPIDASYMKSKFYVWIGKALKDFETSLSAEDERLILRTQDFFALEGGYEATPEQRVIGMAFCDGVLEAVVLKLPE